MTWLLSLEMKLRYVACFFAMGCFYCRESSICSLVIRSTTVHRYVRGQPATFDYAAVDFLPILHSEGSTQSRWYRDLHYWTTHDRTTHYRKPRRTQVWEFCISWRGRQSRICKLRRSNEVKPRSFSMMISTAEGKLWGSRLEMINNQFQLLCKYLLLESYSKTWLKWTVLEWTTESPIWTIEKLFVSTHDNDNDSTWYGKH